MVAYPEDYASVQTHAPIVEGLPVLERGAGGIKQSTERVIELYEDKDRPWAANRDSAQGLYK